MKGTLIAAAVVVIVALFGAAIFLTQHTVPVEMTSTSQPTTPKESSTTSPELTSDDFTVIEEMLNDLESLGFDNLDSDFGVGAIAGSWD